MANEEKKTLTGVFLNGLIHENPTFTLMLGMCPTLAITTAAINGVGMGLATTVVLVFSNLFISLLRYVIPEKVRIPSFIVVIASFVTIVDLLLKAFLPDLSSALGMYIPLIVVNCIIFARAESFAFKNPPALSVAVAVSAGAPAVVSAAAVVSLFSAGRADISFMGASFFFLTAGCFCTDFTACSFLGCGAFFSAVFPPPEPPLLPAAAGAKTSFTFITGSGFFSAFAPPKMNIRAQCSIREISSAAAHLPRSPERNVIARPLPRA